MTKLEAADWARMILERWGFPVLVALACGFVIRQDVIVPLVEAHTKFLDQMIETQQEIVELSREQTRLLYVIQPKTAAYGPQFCGVSSCGP